MAKGVIVVDIPNNCDLCDFCEDIGFYYCDYPGIRKKVDDYIITRPNWCPIKSMPEKQDNDNLYDEYYNGFDVGWNACIDEILKGD